MNPSLMKGCLANELATFPFTNPVDMSSQPLKAVVSSLVKFEGLTDINVVYPSFSFPQAEKPCGNPEEDALIFYLTNHAATLVSQRVHPLQPLGPLQPVVSTYKAQLAVRSFRMFYYMLLICTRESRHDHSDKGGSKYTTMISAYPDSIKAFHKSLAGTSSSLAADRLRNSAPDATLGQYTNFLVDVFFKGSYSSGYGGAAWGKVAEVLRDFSVGKLSAEMLMDTAFTLCHNNGPIFNKGMLFDTYGPEIYKILDVQRSGQIPQLISSGGVKLTSRVKSLWSAFESILGSEFSGPVDWVKVEALGSLKKYPSEIAKMAKSVPPPSVASPVPVSATPTVTANTFPPYPDMLQVYPGQWLTKFKAAR